jgi:hypothetical protein
LTSLRVRAAHSEDQTTSTPAEVRRNRGDDEGGTPARPVERRPSRGLLRPTARAAARAAALLAQGTPPAVEAQLRRPPGDCHHHDWHHGDGPEVPPTESIGEVVARRQFSPRRETETRSITTGEPMRATSSAPATSMSPRRTSAFRPRRSTSSVRRTNSTSPPKLAQAHLASSSWPNSSSSSADRTSGARDRSHVSDRKTRHDHRATQAIRPSGPASRPPRRVPSRRSILFAFCSRRACPTTPAALPDFSERASELVLYLVAGARTARRLHAHDRLVNRRGRHRNGHWTARRPASTLQICSVDSPASSPQSLARRPLSLQLSPHTPRPSRRRRCPTWRLSRVRQGTGRRLHRPAPPS